MIRLPVSVGEAVDKWNILQIKRGAVVDSHKAAFIAAELQQLAPELEPLLEQEPIRRLYAYLDYFNREIWTLCDAVRGAVIDTHYAQHCINIIKYNDARFRVKNQINQWASSTLREQKNFNPQRLGVRWGGEIWDSVAPVVRYLSFCYDEVVLAAAECPAVFRDDRNVTVAPELEHCVAILTWHPDTLREQLRTDLQIDYDRIVHLADAPSS